jgi:hypothetical protein
MATDGSNPTHRAGGEGSTSGSGMTTQSTTESIERGTASALPQGIACIDPQVAACMDPVLLERQMSNFTRRLRAFRTGQRVLRLKQASAQASLQHTLQKVRRNGGAHQLVEGCFQEEPPSMV